MGGERPSHFNISLNWAEATALPKAREMNHLRDVPEWMPIAAAESRTLLLRVGLLFAV